MRNRKENDGSLSINFLTSTNRDPRTSKKIILEFIDKLTRNALDFSTPVFPSHSFCPCSHGHILCPGSTFRSLPCLRDCCPRIRRLRALSYPCWIGRAHRRKCWRSHDGRHGGRSIECRNLVDRVVGGRCSQSHRHDVLHHSVGLAVEEGTGLVAAAFGAQRVFLLVVYVLVYISIVLLHTMESRSR